VDTFERVYEGDLVELTVGPDVVEATSGHPFWVVEGEGLAERPRAEHIPEVPFNARTPGRWVDAGDLQTGDVLLLQGSACATIDRKVRRHVCGTVCNFHVEELQCYAVGRSRILVHNNSAAEQPAPNVPVRDRGQFGRPFNRNQPEIFPEDEIARQAWIAQQDNLAAAANQANPHLAGRTPLAGTRGTGVSRATAAEVDLVRRTGAGTIEGGWTPTEIQFIQQTGRLPDGIVGHHINNVAQFPEWAGDPRNIRFVRGQAGNLAEHGGNFQNSTIGPLIER
jgi:hypothetical protein